MAGRFGFRTHPAKTRVTGPKDVHRYLGIIVMDDSLRLPRKYLDSVETRIRAAEKHGLAAAESDFGSRQTGRLKKSFAGVVEGKINHIGAVQGRNDPTYGEFVARFNEIRRAQ